MNKLEILFCIHFYLNNINLETFRGNAQKLLIGKIKNISLYSFTYLNNINLEIFLEENAQNLLIRGIFPIY